MIRLKRSIRLLILVSGIAIHGYSQNLYDLDHSKKYADFLYKSQQYKLAAMEFERLAFMDSANMLFRQNLVRSYRKSNQISQGLKRINEWYPGPVDDTIIFTELIKLNILDMRYDEVLQSMNGQVLLPVYEKNYYQLSAILLKRNWDEANEFINNIDDKSWPGFIELSELYQRQNQIKYKNPGLALGLSAIVPGLGKVYSNDWKDGLVSFLFVATNALQAYRGFSNDGINSTYGWIFGSLSLGFYAGNLFGSWKSARNYNKRSEDVIYYDIQSTILDGF